MSCFGSSQLSGMFTLENSAQCLSTVHSITGQEHQGLCCLSHASTVVHDLIRIPLLFSPKIGYIPPWVLAKINHSPLMVTGSLGSDQCELSNRLESWSSSMMNIAPLLGCNSHRDHAWVQWGNVSANTIWGKACKTVSHLNSGVSRSRKWGKSDVGFPSVCCYYHWLIKKLIWAFSQAEQR